MTRFLFQTAAHDLLEKKRKAKKVRILQKLSIQKTIKLVRRANKTTLNKILKLNNRKLLYGATCKLAQKLQKVPPPPSKVQELSKTSHLLPIQHQPLQRPNQQRRQNAIEKANQVTPKLSKKQKIKFKKSLSRPKARTLLKT